MAVLARAPAQQAPAPGTAQIAGTVRNAADEKPLARARVVATADALGEPRATLTNSDGTYSFTDLPAGSYTVSATRPGFAAQIYGRDGRSAARGLPWATASRSAASTSRWPPDT